MVSKINNPIRLLQFIKGNDYYKIISSQSWHTSLIYISKTSSFNWILFPGNESHYTFLRLLKLATHVFEPSGCKLIKQMYLLVLE